jgi:hypothetical protein
MGASGGGPLGSVPRKALVLLPLWLASGVAWATPTDTAADTATTGFAPTDTADTGTPDTTGDTALPGDTGGPDLDVDADLDGYTPREGDCDDANRDAHPGLPEVCNDQADNDCDGLYDEACDDSVRFASLRGGGGCTGGSGLAGTQASIGPAALLLVLPLCSFWWRRRR